MKIKGIAIKIIRALVNKGIEDEFLKIYQVMDKKLNNQERQQLLSLIKYTDEDTIVNYIIQKGFEKRILNQSKETKPEKRTPESKENIKKRQKQFLQRKKQEGAKKLQIYIAEDTHLKLKKLQEKYNTTQGDLIKLLIDDKYAQI